MAGSCERCEGSSDPIKCGAPVAYLGPISMSRTLLHGAIFISSNHFTNSHHFTSSNQFTQY